MNERKQKEAEHHQRLRRELRLAVTTFVALFLLALAMVLVWLGSAGG